VVAPLRARPQLLMLPPLRQRARLLLLSPLLLLWADVAAAPRPATLDLTITDDGLFTVTHDGQPWLSGGEVQVAGLSAAARTLVPAAPPSKRSGHDSLGAHEATTLTWRAAAAADANGSDSGAAPLLLETSFRTYPADPSLIVFEQRFPTELQVTTEVTSGATAPSSHASTVFPGFTRSAFGSSGTLDCFTFIGAASYGFPSLQPCNTSSYQDGGLVMGATPLVLYDAQNFSLPMAVFSPLSTPMAMHMTADNTLIGAGVKRSAQSTPAGWSQLFILSAGVGINDGMMHWGDHFLRYSGRAQRADLYGSTVLSTIGYWTSNGGYYHYANFSNVSLMGGSSYEEVLPKVHASHKEAGLHFGHWQFDSWWYPKEGADGTYASNGGGGVMNWTALPDVFPHGMAAINQALGGVPMVMHNRQWSPDSAYVRTDCLGHGCHWLGGNYTSQTIITDSEKGGDKFSAPVNASDFFTWFFEQQPQWNLQMYEQDWMISEYSGVHELQGNVSLADAWLEGMAVGAAAANVSVMYCMPSAQMILSGAQHPAVTTARASHDYFSVSDNQVRPQSSFSRHDTTR
jgi:hypothetical protein